MLEIGSVYLLQSESDESPFFSFSEIRTILIPVVSGCDIWWTLLEAASPRAATETPSQPSPSRARTCLENGELNGGCISTYEKSRAPCAEGMVWPGFIEPACTAYNTSVPYDGPRIPASTPAHPRSHPRTFAVRSGGALATSGVGGRGGGEGEGRGQRG